MTKRLIKEAFIKLMEKTKLNKITVKQICENADINRSTFYAHYSDQYKLFDEIEEDIETAKEVVGVAKDIIDLL